MRENTCKRSNQQGINFQNIQTAHAAQYKKKNQKMGRRSKQIFLQRRHANGQKAHKRTFNIFNYQRNVNQNYNEVSPYVGHNGHHQKLYKE